MYKYLACSSASSSSIGATSTASFWNSQTLRYSSTRAARHLGARNMASATAFYDFKPKTKKGDAFDLHSLENKVVLVVNTASKCGFTPQFDGLEKLYKKINGQDKYKDQFVILGFPCNQFGNQDPGDNDSIQNFCQVNYGVTFPVLGKTDVNGANAEPLFEWLKAEVSGIMGIKRVKWNFEKWLVGRDGKVKGRWASFTKPESLEADVVKQLEAKTTKSEL